MEYGIKFSLFILFSYYRYLSFGGCKQAYKRFPPFLTKLYTATFVLLNMSWEK